MENEEADAGPDGREITFSNANGDREMFIFLAQLNTSRIGNLSWMIRTLLYEMTID